MVDRKLNDWLPGKFKMFSLNKLLHGWSLPTWDSPPCRLALVSDRLIGRDLTALPARLPAYKKKLKRDRTLPRDTDEQYPTLRKRGLTRGHCRARQRYVWSQLLLVGSWYMYVSSCNHIGTNKTVSTEWTISVCFTVTLSMLFSGLTAKYQSRVRARHRIIKRGGSLQTFTFLSDIPAAGAEVDTTHNTTRSTSTADRCSSEWAGRIYSVS